MNKMLSYLAGVDTANPGFLFRAIFLKCMPTDIRTHLVALKTETIATLANKTDKLFASRVIPFFMLDQSFDDIPQHTEAVPVLYCSSWPSQFKLSVLVPCHLWIFCFKVQSSLFLPSICLVFSAPAGGKRAEAAQE